MSKNAGYEEVKLGEVQYFKPKEMTAGQTFEGRFIEVKAGKYDNATYMLETADGTIGINGTGKLASLMAKVALGSLVKITYLGKDEITSGQWKGSDAHNFKVLAKAATNDSL